MTFVEELKRPYNIFSTVLAIVSISLGVFFYVKGNKTKSLSYRISEPSSIIYDSKNSSSKIQVLERIDTLPIKNSDDVDIAKHVYVPFKNDVYLLNGVIWNSGDLPINQSDVRKSLTLNLNTAIKIIDFKIIKQIDPEVAEFSLKPKNSKSLELKWKYFDPGYAVKFQIIYTADESSKLNVSGKILDISNFQNVSTLKRIDPLTRYASIITVAMSLLTIGYGLITKRFKTKKDYVLLTIMTVATVGLIGIVIFSLSTPNIPIPIN